MTILSEREENIRNSTYRCFNSFDRISCNNQLKMSNRPTPGTSSIVIATIARNARVRITARLGSLRGSMRNRPQTHTGLKIYKICRWL